MIGIEGVVGLDVLIEVPVGRLEGKSAALWGLRIDIVEMREIRGVFQIPED